MADGKTKKSLSIWRIAFVILLIAVWLVALVFKAIKLTVTEGDFWREEVGKGMLLNTKDSLIAYPVRGNIYASDGQLISSTLPRYKMYMDFRCEGLYGGTVKAEDSLRIYLDQFCDELSDLYGEPAESFKKRIKAELAKDKNTRTRRFVFNQRFISFTERQRFLKFHFVRLGKNKTGIYDELKYVRRKPFGSLASRTIGYVDGDQENVGGRCGLEMTYDDVLKGEKGLASRERRNGAMVTVNMVEPIDGCDLITTFDMQIQDIVESELRAVMEKGNSDKGCAVVMDVATGEIRAISNLKRSQYDDQLYERENFAMNSETEPGSTFKIASVMALLDSGKADTSLKIDTKDGVWQEAGWNRPMTDHNHDKGGYGEISLAQAIWYSSNIGVSKPIYEAYKSAPEKFIDKLYSMKLNEPMDLEIRGSGKPDIKHPRDKSKNNKWSGTTLPWTSIGYEIKMPPIYTLTFFNGIANDGVMVKPMFVKAITKDGTAIKRMSTQVLCKDLCHRSTLAKVKDMLQGVIEYGIGNRYGHSDKLPLAGKSGSAQVGYSNGRVESYQLSFCGYFPADKPKYSCIVVVWQKVYANRTSEAFKNIAERVYAMSPVLVSKESEENRIVPYSPIIKAGPKEYIKTVMDEIDMKFKPKEYKTDWVRMTTRDSSVTAKDYMYDLSVVPDVTGMGASDAVYLLENRGLRVDLVGVGEVTSQSIAAGSHATRGTHITLRLR